MKKFVSLALLAASLAVSAKALIVGADVGYLVDGQEEYISGRLGHTFKSGDSLAHQVEVEVGYNSEKDSGAKGELIPVTLNYRAESLPANKLGYYYGLGAGFTYTKVRAFGISDNDTAFTAQAFVGLSYKLGETTTFHAGAKYIWIDNVKLFGLSANIGDDVVLSGGLSVKF